MERSGWFDDDEPDETPPSGPRAWRHPSELGRFGPYGAPARRRRNATRLAGAITIGGAGTLVLVAAAGTTMFGGATTARDGSASQEATTLVSVSRPAAAALVPSWLGTTTSVVAAGATTAVRSQPATAAPTTPAPAAPAASAPARVGLRVGNATATVPAVVDDEGMIVAGTDDLAGATQAQVVLGDGRTGAAEVVSADDDGVSRLKPAEPVESTGDRPMTWLGITCDDTPASAATTVAPSTSTSATAAPIASTVPSASTAATTPATTSTTAPVSDTTAVATTMPSTAATARALDDRAAATTSAPASRATDAPHPTEPAAPGATTTVAPPVGVVVRTVHDGSPAAVAGVRPGDVVTAVAGRPTRHIWSLVLAVWHQRPGDEVTLTLVRAGRTVQLTVVLAASPLR